MSHNCDTNHKCNNKIDVFPQTLAGGDTSHLKSRERSGWMILTNLEQLGSTFTWTSVNKTAYLLTAKQDTRMICDFLFVYGTLNIFKTHPHLRSWQIWYVLVLFSLVSRTAYTTCWRQRKIPASGNIPCTAPGLPRKMLKIVKFNKLRTWNIDKKFCFKLLIILPKFYFHHEETFLDTIFIAVYY